MQCVSIVNSRPQLQEHLPHILSDFACGLVSITAGWWNAVHLQKASECLWVWAFWLEWVWAFWWECFFRVQVVVKRDNKHAFAFRRESDIVSSLPEISVSDWSFRILSRKSYIFRSLHCCLHDAFPVASVVSAKPALVYWWVLGFSGVLVCILDCDHILSLLHCAELLQKWWIIVV